MAETQISLTQEAKGEAWSSWTPIWENLTIGNAVVTAKYVQIGKTVIGRLNVVFGSTTSVSGDFTFSLPVTASAYSALNNSVIGTSSFLDSGTVALAGICRITSTTVAKFRTYLVSGSLIGGQIPSATAPFTWATNDEIFVQFTYEAA